MTDETFAVSDAQIEVLASVLRSNLDFTKIAIDVLYVLHDKGYRLVKKEIEVT